MPKSDVLLQLLQIAVAIFAGAMIPIILFFLEKWWTRRSDLQAWFADKYIENGIDALDEFFRRWAALSSLPAGRAAELLNHPAFGEVPHQPIARVSALTGATSFQNWFNAMRSLWLKATRQNDYDRALKFHQHCDAMSRRLQTLRQELLKQKLKSKADVYGIQQSEPAKRFNAALSELTDAIVQDPGTTKYEAPSSS